MLERFARLALDCIHREYPNQIAHALQSAADVAPPRALTPMFYGCYDWHSAVHGHWTLVRLLRVRPDSSLAPAARAALARSFTAANAAAEAAYLQGPGRGGFERPYGLAWLLLLAAELRESAMTEWAAVLAPLEAIAARRFASWLPKLSHPVRSGTHSQTAFALTLVWDWAQAAGRDDVAGLVRAQALRLYGADVDAPLAYEPSGEDFLSPCLMQADLLRRLLPAAEFGRWLSEFLPGLPTDGSAAWLTPAVVADPADGRLAHLDGLNLSRAWNLEAVADALPEGDARIGALRGAAETHRRAGLAAVTGEHYAGGHWLGTFATYLLTGRSRPGG